MTEYFFLRWKVRAKKKANQHLHENRQAKELGRICSRPLFFFINWRDANVYASSVGAQNNERPPQKEKENNLMALPRDILLIGLRSGPDLGLD